MTYPQEGEISQVAFEGYFFACDVFIGVIPAPNSKAGEITVVDQDQQVRSIESEKGERDWEDCIGGFYYVSLILNSKYSEKPNTLVAVDQA